MKTATVSEFRARMKEHLQEIEKDQDVLILSGPKKKDFVVLTLEHYNAMEETAHLLSTQANTERLMKSIAQNKAGQIAHSFQFAEPEILYKKNASSVAGLPGAKRRDIKRSRHKLKKKTIEKNGGISPVKRKTSK